MSWQQTLERAADLRLVHLMCNIALNTEGHRLPVLAFLESRVCLLLLYTAMV